MPELPAAKRARYESTLGLSPYLAAVLSAEKETADWFETALAATAAKVGQPVTKVALRVANFVSTDLFGALKKLGKEIGDSPVCPDALAKLLAPLGITVNAISPGFIDSVSAPPEELAGMTKRIPAGYIGTVDDTVAAVRYLLSDEARYVNGANIQISGAWGV